MNTQHSRRRIAGGAMVIAGWVAFSVAPTFAQETLWQVYLEDGEEAYKAGRYAESEKLFKLALVEAEKLGPSDPRLATSLNNLAEQYRTQGKYDQAEPLHKRALGIREKALGPDHPEVARSLNNVAELYRTQGKYDQAEPLFKRSLTIWERALGPDHPDVATSLNNLAEMYCTQGKYDQAEPLHKRALAISEKALGPDHPDVAGSLNNLAGVYKSQGKYDQAEPLYQRSLTIWEKALGQDHPDLATNLNNLGALYYAQGKYDQAEPLLKQALAICEKALGPNHPDVAGSVNNLARLYYAQGKYDQAEPLHKRALATMEKVLGQDHPSLAKMLENYADLLKATSRQSEAYELLARARIIRNAKPTSRETPMSETGLAATMDAQRPLISASDAHAFTEFMELPTRWNRAAAPLVRDYLDPNVPAGLWVREASVYIGELRAVQIDMNMCSLAIKDLGIRKTLQGLATNYRVKLDCLTGLHNAVAQGDAMGEQRARQDLSEAAAQGQSLGEAMLERLRPYVDPQVLTDEVRKQAKEIADLMKPK